MFQNDYLIREVCNLARTLTMAFFHKETTSIEMFDEQGDVLESGLFYHKLKKLIGNSQINEAENILCEEIEQNRTLENLQVAIQFYKDLQELSDQTLLECDFSRQEIFEGYDYIQKLLQEMNRT
jgi:hypothetical protein